MGSSREQAAIALKASGVKAIIAESFARIFYRNAINNGLPAITAPGINNKTNENDWIKINIETGEIIINNKILINSKPITGIALEIIKAGGLINFLKHK